MALKRDPWPLLIFIAIVIALYVYGCRELKELTRAQRQRACGAGSIPEVPQLPKAAVQGTAPVRKDVSLASHVTLAWSNPPPIWQGVTGLEASTDFVHWSMATNMPARLGEVMVTLSNRPPYEFYRAFNSLQ